MLQNKSLKKDLEKAKSNISTLKVSMTNSDASHQPLENKKGYGEVDQLAQWLKEAESRCKRLYENTKILDHSSLPQLLRPRINLKGTFTVAVPGRRR